LLRRRLSLVVAVHILRIQVVVGRGGFALSAAEVEAAAKAATTEITACYASAEYKEHFAPRAGQSEVGVDIVVAELLGDVETETSIFVVNFPLFLVTQRGICVIYFSELLSRTGIVGVFIWVMS